MICFPHLPTTSPMSPPPSPCSFCSCHPVVICPPWCFSARLSTPWFQRLCTRSSLCWTHSSGGGGLNDLLPHFFQVSARTSFHQRGLPWPTYLKQHSSATLLLPPPPPPSIVMITTDFCLLSDFLHYHFLLYKKRNLLFRDCSSPVPRKMEAQSRHAINIRSSKRINWTMVTQHSELIQSDHGRQPMS